ncbi:hypothetical protein FRC07_011821, partial [Ceratobasidium sp. 392]
FQSGADWRFPAYIRQYLDPRQVADSSSRPMQVSPVTVPPDNLVSDTPLLFACFMRLDTMLPSTSFTTVYGAGQI